MSGLRMLLERERIAVALCVFAVIVISWAYLWSQASMDLQPGMNMKSGMDMNGMDMRLPLSFLFAMWWIMMVAMMLPSAAPMILLFATVSGRRREEAKPYVPTAIFAGTYLAIWGLFSILAAVLQWWTGMSMEPMTNRWLAGALLIGAGLYQLTPLKQLCLRQCQAPLLFVLTRWRAGLRGALVMGTEHGVYCLGCCWLLMTLLFVGGVMNLYWVIGIALYVLVEKFLPAGGWPSRTLGVVLSIAGVWVLLTVR